MCPIEYRSGSFGDNCVPKLELGNEWVRSLWTSSVGVWEREKKNWD
jgi:hypothetical protein